MGRATLTQDGYTVPIIEPPDGGAGGSECAFASELTSRYQAARWDNPRTRPLLAWETIAFGGTPSADTIGVANSSISTTGYTNYGISTSSIYPLRMYGALPYLAGSGNALQARSFDNLSGSRTQGVARTKLITDEPLIIFKGFGNYAYQFLVDGQMLDGLVTSGSGASDGLLMFDFTQVGGRKLREIEVLQCQDDTITNVYLKPTATIGSPIDSPRILFITDSLGNTAPDSKAYHAFVSQVSDYLGVPDCYNFAEGGTGYVAGTSPQRTFAGKVEVAASMFGDEVDAVAIFGGQNDADDASFQPAVAAAITAARAAWPHAPVVVFGSWAANSTGAQNSKATQEAKIAAAVTAADDEMVQFVPTMTDTKRWITGSGNTSSPAGDGNADILFGSSDGVHWIKAGHTALAPKIADGVFNSIMKAFRLS